ncbi:MAG: hypothetical protein M3032_12055 [Verrucomicrobiota bacterium]|nr:hypothetical protein [Verrucomicrobiota bacterium]
MKKGILAALGVLALATSGAFADGYTPDPRIMSPDPGVDLPAAVSDSGTTLALLALAGGVMLLARRRATAAAL